MSAIDERIASMLGRPVVAVGRDQSTIRGTLTRRRSAFGAVDRVILPGAGVTLRKYVHLRYMHRDWLP